MRGQNWASIAAGAVLIPIAAGWTWPYGSVSIVVCTRCGKQIPGSSKFCPNCGLDIYATSPTASTASPLSHGDHSYCTVCGKPLKPLARFCGSCGEPVS